ncbi:MAG: Aminopeptidase N [Candidatus Tokpelaia hoelldobleri]|uniref:Aminopeptidase N n=1 Tax=Candidatus Tokpelaia hoelldobleri TaxID=1902579 RepID=A0A1U9JUF6_9HYPH|nr:MAG: Aminopeptidase N [Candidatus Tokpelaia hoelldoblerii]
MNAVAHPVFRLEDYRQTPYTIPRTELCFNLHPEKTQVQAKLAFTPRQDTPAATPLVLDGDELILVSVAIDGKPLPQNAYSATADRLEIFNPPAAPFTLETTTQINPQANRQLMGLYRSNGIFCTQCEAEGFRRITYFYDRPDVLSVYTVRIEAEAKSCPVLLANGNPRESGALEDGRHYAVWHDPFPKPSYLFALVGGDLEAVHDTFTTAGGKKVALAIYVEKSKGNRALYAMDALKRSMRWDEEAFGREYDLDVFNIVAVSDFNMGAMENKGLNIFNDKYVLADPQTATDADYAGIERVIAHEYFHNWTGDRITCRDWFQLCLKEGLTVYRDQEFSSDQRSRPVVRIGEVRMLAAAQFPEDAGPLAHPVRPRQYAEINNFYTTTIYEKGAEVVRMVHTLLGDTLFRAGMDLYFQRHDGEACTIEDFIACFAETSGRDFSQFMLWYEQAGTPHIKAEFDFDEKGNSLTITLEQSLKSTPGQTEKQPMVLPVRFGLVGADGRDMAFQADNHVEGDVMVLSGKRQSFCFTGLKSRPVPSLLRGFSAPVTIELPLSDKDMAFLARHDSDPVNRWQALNRLLLKTCAQMAQTASAPDEQLVDLIGEIAGDETLDPAFRVMCLSIPSEAEIARVIDHDVDPERIFAAWQGLLAAIAQKHQVHFLALWQNIDRKAPYSPDAASAGKRALANILLDYLARAENAPQRAADAYGKADNMTDRIAALRILAHQFPHAEQTKAALQDFATRFAADPLVMDKWFAVQATRAGADTLEQVQALTEHPLFSYDNPNRVRALIATFAAGSQTGFNRADGKAYDFLAETILMIDKQNPQLASRLLTTMRSWRSLEKNRKGKIKTALEKIAHADRLSRDVNDIVTRMLHE